MTERNFKILETRLKQGLKIWQYGRLSIPKGMQDASAADRSGELLSRARTFIDEQKIAGILIDMGFPLAVKSTKILDADREIVQGLTSEGEEVRASPNPLQEDNLAYISPKLLVPDLKPAQTQEPAWMATPAVPETQVTPPPAPSAEATPSPAVTSPTDLSDYVPPLDVATLVGQTAPAPVIPADPSADASLNVSPPAAQTVSPPAARPTPPIDAAAPTETVVTPPEPIVVTVPRRTDTYAVHTNRDPHRDQTRRISIAEALLQLDYGRVEAHEIMDPKLDHKLLSSGRITTAQALQAQALTRGMEYVDVKVRPPTASVANLLDQHTCTAQRVFPYDLDHNDTFIVVTDTPNRELLIRTAVAERSGKPRVEVRVVDTPVLDALIREQYTSGTVLRELHEDLATDAAIPEASLDDANNAVTRFVRETILEGVNKNASDIHIEPMSNGLQVRYRIDGKLIPNFQAPIARSGMGNIVRVVKLMANMDVGNNRVPQDSRLVLNIATRVINLRVSSMPQNDGNEKLVLRILKDASDIPEVEKLGMNPYTLERFLQIIRKPEGLVLVTGPTGSGKSFTLLSTLKRIAKPDRNTQTLEDPIEYRLPGVNQSQINEATGYTFEAGLRSAMRQDPDILLLGEIRDATTAKISLSMANTGHQVLSTLHTITAASAVQRLRDLGVPNYNITPSLQGVMAQRLVRKVCPHCSEAATLPERVVRILADAPVRVPQDKYRTVNPEGCQHCLKGRQGRLPIHELLVVTDTLRDRINEGAPTRELEMIARKEGMLTLAQDGYLKVAEGLIALEDLEEALNEVAEEVSVNPEAV
ncbi:GspE/PulE family protein [Deinococcus petrolearius]|uniref:ATPase, T2SS/T4P/T4SS family n=1 Tax=Deinococcus petrolearius TaxID=1751295 RepID=A0ABW1DLK7_9DEIO